MTRIDLKNLNTDIVFNCLGLGSREVFEDNQMYPVKG